jgi:hypothetical protein
VRGKTEKTLFKGVKNYFKRVYIIKSIKFKGNFKNLGTMNSPRVGVVPPPMASLGYPSSIFLFFLGEAYVCVCLYIYIYIYMYRERERERERERIFPFQVK